MSGNSIVTYIRATSGRQIGAVKKTKMVRGRTCAAMKIIAIVIISLVCGVGVIDFIEKMDNLLFSFSVYIAKSKISLGVI